MELPFTKLVFSGVHDAPGEGAWNKSASGPHQGAQEGREGLSSDNSHVKVSKENGTLQFLHSSPLGASSKQQVTTPEHKNATRHQVWQETACEEALCDQPGRESRHPAQ